MLAETVDAVIGVDAHRDTHSASLVNALGGEVAAITVTADTAGYNQLMRWAHQYSQDHEPSGRWKEPAATAPAYSAPCDCEAHRRGVRPAKARSSTPGGKSDATGVRRAAREALAGEQQIVPRWDGACEPITQ